MLRNVKLYVYVEKNGSQTVFLLVPRNEKVGNCFNNFSKNSLLISSFTVDEAVIEYSLSTSSDVIIEDSYVTVSREMYWRRCFDMISVHDFTYDL